MLWAAKQAKLTYVVNVIINDKKEAIYAVAGDVEAAHLAGCEFLYGLCRVKTDEADIAISTNGGYPLDQNIYQAVKGMTAAEAAVREGGVIIMLAKSNDGHGGEGFYHELADESDINKGMQAILERGRNETVPDQWQSQILLRILKRASVVYVSDAEDALIRDLHMIPAHSLAEAIATAKSILKNPSPSIVAIPDGIAVMVVNN
jgi:nickel-dependent lactate racemase